MCEARKTGEHSKDEAGSADKIKVEGFGFHRAGCFAGDKDGRSISENDDFGRNLKELHEGERIDCTYC